MVYLFNSDSSLALGKDILALFGLGGFEPGAASGCQSLLVGLKFFELGASFGCWFRIDDFRFSKAGE